MTDDILIRAATLEDLPTLLTFEQGIISAERPYDSTLKPDPISYYDIGAVSGERLIGSGYAIKKASRHYLNPPYHAFIGFLYVEPDFRGRGVKQRVLEHLFAWARANDLPEIHLTVYPDNAPAIRAYEKVGFEPYILEMRMNLDDHS